MNERERYSCEWSISADHFLANRNYDWMCSQIKKYPIVLEIGCGTGQSTLKLIQHGHTVIAVEKNEYCLKKAIEHAKAAGITVYDNINELSNGGVLFIEDDVTSEVFLSDTLPNLLFDVVVCWNIGTYWDKQMFQCYMQKLLDYGLSCDQIKANPESSYSELIIWSACQIASSKKVAVNIVDRGIEKVTKYSDPYYITLKKEFSFKRIEYKNLKATSLS